MNSCNQLRVLWKPIDVQARDDICQFFLHRYTANETHNFQLSARAESTCTKSTDRSNYRSVSAPATLTRNSSLVQKCILLEEALNVANVTLPQLRKRSLNILWPRLYCVYVMNFETEKVFLTFTERYLAAKWLQRFLNETSTTEQALELRNSYLKLLLYVLHYGVLDGPFKNLPPEDELPPVPNKSEVSILKNISVKCLALCECR